MVRETIAEASITALTPDRSGISLGCAGRPDHGIGRVAFVLVDLAKEESANLIDRGDLQYAPPLPTLVREVWMSSGPLTAGATYRAFVHLYDRTGVNLVAYDRRDFTID